MLMSCQGFVKFLLGVLQDAQVVEHGGNFDTLRALQRAERFEGSLVVSFG